MARMSCSIGTRWHIRAHDRPVTTLVSRSCSLAGWGSIATTTTQRSVASFTFQGLPPRRPTAGVRGPRRIRTSWSFSETTGEASETRSQSFDWRDTEERAISFFLARAPLALGAPEVEKAEYAKALAEYRTNFDAAAAVEKEKRKAKKAAKE